MDNHGSGQKPQTNRRKYEPRRFKSLVAELHREAEQRRPRQYDHAPHEAPLVGVTRRLVIATVALAVVGLLGFGAAVLQWLTLRSTDETMRGQLEEMQAEQRPWVYFDILEAGENNNIALKVDQNMATFGIKYALRNTGHSPTLLAQIGFDVIPVDITGSPEMAGFLKTVETRTCKNILLSEGGDAIFPNQQPVTNTVIKPIERARFQSMLMGGNQILSILIVGCVKYQISADGRGVGQTAAASAIAHPSPSGFVPFAFRPGDVLQINEVSSVRLPLQLAE